MAKVGGTGVPEKEVYGQFSVRLQDLMVTTILAHDESVNLPLTIADETESDFHRPVGELVTPGRVYRIELLPRHHDKQLILLVLDCELRIGTEPVRPKIVGENARVDLDQLLELVQLATIIQ